MTEPLDVAAPDARVVRGRVVVKLGSRSITSAAGPDSVLLSTALASCAAVQADGWRVALVSSGAASLGRVTIGRRVGSWTSGTMVKAPSRQLAAAVGQPELVFSYRFLSDRVNIQICQILVSEADLHAESAMGALSALVSECLESSILPIINGNDPTDPVASNNDDIAAAIAIACGADRLIFLTDVDGVYDSDPMHGGAVIDTVEADAIGAVPNLGKSREGTGGIDVKLRAAQIAAYNGIATTIAKATTPHVLERILSGDAVGSTVPSREPRKPLGERWIAGIAPTAGSITINLEAERSVRDGSSLFGSGIKKVRGAFPPESVIAIVDPKGGLIGRGRVRVSGELLGLIRALSPAEAASVYLEIVSAYAGIQMQGEMQGKDLLSDRPPFVHAMELVRQLASRRSNDALRGLADEVVRLAPGAVLQAALAGGGRTALLHNLAQATGKMSLIHSEHVAIYSE